MGVEVVTFGCRLNMVESEAMRRSALDAGHDDIVIVNTCAVTAEASRQARQAIRRLGREHPGRRIIVTGCGAQTQPEDFAGMSEVTRVIGNAEKTSPSTWLSLARSLEPRANDTRRIAVEDISNWRSVETGSVSAVEHHTRGFLAVQNGCDHRCTFCIIPFGRGPSRSLPMGAVVEQVKQLVGIGQKEIVLTGVDLTSYGGDLPGTPQLGTLVQMILRHVPDLPRLRLSSIDSIEADDALVDAMASDQRLMPYLHLSLQSGDDMVLKRMKRRHSRADSIEFCQKMRALRRDIAFGADLIAGFPTETEEMFENSLSLITACGLTHVHVFPYSPRAGTPAAKMPQVPRDIIKARAHRLREAAQAALHAHLSAQNGKTFEVLTERGGMGRTPDFTPVRLGAVEANQLLSVTIGGHNGRELVAGSTRPAAGG